MKIIWREWRKDTKAMIMLGIYALLSTVYIILNTRVVILISSCLSDLSNWEQHLMILVVVCIIQTIISMIRGALRPMAIHHCFGTLSNQYSDKILDADVAMFTKKSCAQINTASEFLFNIANIGSTTVRFALNMITVGATMVSIYIIGGLEMIIPIVIVYVLGAFICKFLFAKFGRLEAEAAKLKKHRNQELENVINGFLEVRSFGTQKFHRLSIHNSNEKIYKARWNKSKCQSVINFLFETVDTIGMVIVIMFSIANLRAGMITQATAMSLIMYVFRLMNPLTDMVDFLDTVSENMALAESYDEIISYVNRLDQNGNYEMDTFRDAIEVSDVSFAYSSNSSSVLRNINMVIPKGTRIGICGISGAGKSTLFKLLNRFYSPDSGVIRVDGIDLQEITEESYRRHVGTVHQENMIFPGTIWDNVIYGNFNMPEYEVIMACKKAHIYDFIMSLPDRFQTVVGPRGLTLSGGQKQRIALARLFLSNPEIIFLDEATSALDNTSETFIQDAIDGLEGKTIITVAHRLSTIRNSDIIYVMGTNGILERGTHDELMALKGEYYKMNK